jgi:hypothetical protein
MNAELAQVICLPGFLGVHALVAATNSDLTTS